jgi:uncharacterized membrane protein YedE/YeeE
MPHPLPWYIAGPIIGLVVPALLLIGNRAFGISSNFRHACAAVAPRGIEFFRYDWRREGGWNLAFLAGLFVGATLAWRLAPADVTLAPATLEALRGLGITDFSGLAPREIFDWSQLVTVKGFATMVVGGFLVGFGTAWAGGCTSGHAITGLADWQLASLVAVIGFFAGGLLGTHALLPVILQ